MIILASFWAISVPLLALLVITLTQRTFVLSRNPWMTILVGLVPLNDDRIRLEGSLALSAVDWKGI